MGGALNKVISGQCVFIALYPDIPTLFSCLSSATSQSVIIPTSHFIFKIALLVVISVFFVKQVISLPGMFDGLRQLHIYRSRTVCKRI